MNHVSYYIRALQVLGYRMYMICHPFCVSSRIGRAHRAPVKAINSFFFFYGFTPIKIALKKKKTKNDN